MSARPGSGGIEDTVRRIAFRAELPAIAEIEQNLRVVVSMGTPGQSMVALARILGVIIGMAAPDERGAMIEAVMRSIAHHAAKGQPQ